MNKKTYSLCEAVADIAYIAAEEKYETEDLLNGQNILNISIETLIGVTI